MQVFTVRYELGCRPAWSQISLDTVGQCGTVWDSAVWAPPCGAGRQNTLCPSYGHNLLSPGHRRIGLEAVLHTAQGRLLPGSGRGEAPRFVMNVDLKLSGKDCKISCFNFIRPILSNQF